MRRYLIPKRPAYIPPKSVAAQLIHANHDRARYRLVIEAALVALHYPPHVFHSSRLSVIAVRKVNEKRDVALRGELSVIKSSRFTDALTQVYAFIVKI